MFAQVYRVLKPVSESAGIAAYLVSEEGQSTPRTLKTLPPDLAEIPALRARFEHDLLGARITSDHVARTLAAGLDEASGLLWFTREALRGESLASFVSDRGALPVEETVALLDQLGEGLAAIHAAGLVHQDVRPDNVFLMSSGDEGAAPRVVVLDLGLATFLTAARGSSAAPSAEFMAPEQLANKPPILPASDVWSFGLIAFRLLTGASYWSSEGGNALRKEILEKPLPKASERANALSAAAPVGFDAWFAKCVARPHSARYATAREALDELKKGWGSPERAALPSFPLGSDAKPELPKLAPPPQRGPLPSFSLDAPPSARGPLPSFSLDAADDLDEPTPDPNKPSPTIFGAPAFASSANTPPPGNTFAPGFAAKGATSAMDAFPGGPPGVPPDARAPFASGGFGQGGYGPPPNPPGFGPPPGYMPPTPPKSGGSSGLIIAIVVAGIFFLGLLVVGGAGAAFYLTARRSAGPVALATAPGEGPIPVTSRDPSWGDRYAPVTLVVFSDFQCPFCKRSELTLTTLRTMYGPKTLRIVWKNNPLPFHASAKPAAVAAMGVFASGGDSAFWKFHTAAFAAQDGLNDDNFAAWSLAAGVEPNQWRGAKASGPTSKVEEDMALAKTIGATGTPAFYINGVKISGAQPLSKFIEVIDQQKAAAAALSGVKPEDVYPKLAAENFGKNGPDGAGTPSKADDNKVWRVPVTGAPSRGPVAAKVTIVEFGDFQCPFCKRAQSTLTDLRKRYGADVRIVWRHNPLAFHKSADPAAQLAIEAFVERGDAGFWEAHDLLYENQRNLTRIDLMSYAGKLGLSKQRASAAIDNKLHSGQIAADQRLAREVSAEGTPVFFINGRRVQGAQPYEKLATIIEEEIRHADKLMARGVALSDVYTTILAEAAADDKNLGVGP